MTVADHIFKYLNENDMSQHEFSIRTHCCENSVSKYLSGRTLPHAKNLKSIAVELGITVDELLEDV